MIYTLKTNDNFLEISYQPKDRFVSCIQKKTISSFPFVLTNRIAMAETSPDLNSCALKGRRGRGIWVLPASHGYNTDTHLGSCVYAQCELCDLAKPGSGNTALPILSYCLWFMSLNMSRGAWQEYRFEIRTIEENLEIDSTYPKKRKI